MSTVKPTRSLWPYTIALLVGAVTYMAVFWWSAMHGLAAAATFLLGLIVFICSRLIQSRGKLSLKVTIFVMPLVTVMLCIGLQQLNPYLQRQRTNSALKRTGLTVYQRNSQVLGEWYRDSSTGVMLPYWLVRLCGDDAMGEVHSIHGSFEALQSVDLQKLYLPKLRSVHLSREGAEPPVSVELIEFLIALNKRQETKVEIFLDEIALADMPALKELSKFPETGTLKISSFANKIQSDVDLSVLPAKCWLRLNGDRLTLPHAMQIKDLTFVELLVSGISAAHIEALGRRNSKLILALHNNVFDEATTQAIMRYQGGAIRLINCKFPDQFKVDDQKCKLQLLNLENTPIAESTLLKWLQMSNVESFQTSDSLSPSMLEECKQIKSMQRIYYQSASGEPAFVDLTTTAK